MATMRNQLKERGTRESGGLSMHRVVTSILPLLLAAIPGGGVRASEEGARLAMQISDAPRPPEELVEKTSALLEAVRAREPAVAKIGVPLPWSPSTLILTLAGDGASIDVSNPAATGHAGLDRLHRRFPVRSIDRLFGKVLILRFEEEWNMPALARLYGALDGVKSATTDGVIGASSGVTLRRKEPGYVLSFWAGSGDCPAGCIDTTTWSFAVRPDLTLIGPVDEDAREERERPGSPGLGIGIGGPGFGGPPRPRDPAPGPGPDLDVDFSSSPRPRR